MDRARARARTRITPHAHAQRRRRSSSSSVLSGSVTSCCDSLRRSDRWHHENPAGDGRPERRFCERRAPEPLRRYDCTGIRRLRRGRWEICHASLSPPPPEKPHDSVLRAARKRDSAESGFEIFPPLAGKAAILATVPSRNWAHRPRRRLSLRNNRSPNPESVNL